MKKKSTGALIVAAGKGIRSKSIVPKQYLHLGDKYVLERNIENFMDEPLIDFVVVVINEAHLEFYEKAIAKINNPKLLPKCFGGKTRSESVKNGLKAISEIGCKKILIQDGARPFTSNKIIKNCIEGLDKFDVVFPAIKIPDTLYIEVKENNQSTIDALGLNRDFLLRAQTPQAFHFDYIYQTHMNCDEHHTDDVYLALIDKKKIDIVSGSEYNFKITTPEDIEIAKKLLLNV